MSLADIKALTFDTGGTILDWHNGFRLALAAAGARHGVDRDWAELANELRRRSLKAMGGLGEHEPPAHNIDQAHCFCLDAILEDEGLSVFDESDRHSIAYDAPHGFTCWPDFPDAQRQLRQKFIVTSFTILSYRLIIDTAKANGLTWDAVLSCEGLGVYKLLPQAYQKAAHFLQLPPSECLMVASHPYDLNAARGVGFRTALVRRPTEWGVDTPAYTQDYAVGDYDLIVDSFPELVTALS